MGYNIEFDGEFELDRELTMKDYRWLTRLNEERHDDIDGDLKYNGLSWDEQPSTYCSWCPTEDGDVITHDGSEKSSGNIFWIRHIVSYLKEKGYVVNGEVEWEGDEAGDVGKIVVENNDVIIKKAKLTFE